MSIDAYRDFGFEEILALLEKNKIQVMIIPRGEEGFYSITCCGGRFYVSLFFDEYHIVASRKFLVDINKNNGEDRIYQALVSSDAGVPSLKEKYLRKRLFRKYKGF